MGKISFFYSKDAVGTTVLNACVVKKDRISGSVSDNDGARNVLFQVEQALDTAHINGHGEGESVSKVFIISPRDCSPVTMNAIKGKLQQRANQAAFLCGGALLEQFALHWSEFLAFESSFLGSYVSSLQHSFEQEDPIRFLGSQQSLFAGVNKSLGSVYVRQNFKLDLYELEILADIPEVDVLREPISLDGLKAFVENLRFIAALMKNPQSLESGDPAEAEDLAASLSQFAKDLINDWDERWSIHERDSNIAGKSAMPRSLARVQLTLPTLEPQRHGMVNLKKTFSALSERLIGANAFVQAARKVRPSERQLHSSGYIDYCRVADLMRVHPMAFRRVGKPHAVVLSEELLDKVLKPIFITAPAGHGKTSLCKWNTLHDVERLADKSSSISPIYVALHRLSTTTVETCEEAFFRSGEVKELVSRAQKNRKQVRLYLDGLDEVSTVEQQVRLMSLARELSEKYLFVQVIVTGRDYLAAVGLRWLSRIHLAELTDAQVESLIDNWLDGDDSLRIEFQEQLAKTPTLRPLMRIPLLGTLVIAVFKRMRALPENKLKLYEAFTELMCGGWDLAKNVRRDTRFGSSTKLSVLTRLAGLLQISGRRDAQVENLKAAIDQTARTFNEKWQELLDEILEDGLLVRTPSNTFIFSHLSFQEYLAATELNDPQGNRSTQALKDFLRGDDRWREVIAFYLGIVKRPDETEGWMRKTAEQLAEKGADITSRYDFLLEQLAIAWPGWKSRRGGIKV
jgi:hypothetical protein